MTSLISTAAETAGRVAKHPPLTRKIHVTSSQMRGGNLLYFWQSAYTRCQRGRDTAVLSNGHEPPWIDEFPLLGDLTAPEGALTFRDVRDTSTRAAFGSDFTRTENVEFSRAIIAHSPRFQERIARAQQILGPDTVVINVRRGDYYGSRWSAEFAIDIPHHISHAVELLASLDGPSEDYLLVSDDIAWCRRHLSQLVPSSLRIDENRSSMFDDLAILAASRRLILANSTFSYWGSHLASALNAEHRAIAPEYHQRVVERGGPSVPFRSMFDPLWPMTSRSKADPLEGGDTSLL